MCRARARPAAAWEMRMSCWRVRLAGQQGVARRQPQHTCLLALGPRAGAARKPNTLAAAPRCPPPCAAVRAAFPQHQVAVFGGSAPKLTLQQTIELFQQARVVLGPHGAGLSHILFAAPGTTGGWCWGSGVGRRGGLVAGCRLSPFLHAAALRRHQLARHALQPPLACSPQCWSSTSWLTRPSCFGTPLPRWGSPTGCCPCPRPTGCSRRCRWRGMWG